MSVKTATEIPKDAVKFNDNFLKLNKEMYDNCPICNKRKRERLKVCSHKCSAKLKERINWDEINLEEFLLLGIPIETIACKVGVSGNAVRKRLKKLGLPVKKGDREKFKRP